MELRLVFWETSRACNLTCPHCRAQATDKRLSEELTTEEAKRFIKEVASFSKPILVFSGGEPLVREDLFELIGYTHDSGLETALATNATLITYEVACRLKEDGLRLAAVSIYGANAESHDSFCGNRGAFERTLRGIENLRNAGINLQINTTITKMNLHELEIMGDFALRQGAESFHPFFLVPTGRARFIEEEISPEEYEEAFNHLYDFQKSFPLPIKVTCAPHYYRILSIRGRKNNSRGCLAGSSVCFISYKGEVFGCGYLPVVAGDLRKQDFKTIWLGSELFQILRDDLKLQGRCGICEFKRVCGGCRARAYAATGNYLEEEPKCVYQPLRKNY